MKIRVTDPKDLRVGDQVGPFVVDHLTLSRCAVSFRYYGWQHNAVVAELLEHIEVWHDEPEPDVPGERIVARGKVGIGADYWIDGVIPHVFLQRHAKDGDEVIVVRGDTG